MGLFSRELIFGGAYYRRELCSSKWVGLSIPNSPWAYIREGLLSEEYLHLRYWGWGGGGGGGGRSYFRVGLLSEFYSNSRLASDSE